VESITMKMLCSGNPVHITVASAVKKYFPFAEFASRATGYDLRFWDPGSETYFRKQIINYNVFVNSSFICGGGQLALLEATHEEWTKTNISGHIVNIGSTSEHLGVTDNQAKDNVYGKYSIQKRALRDRSLQLNGLNNIKTTHIIAGGLNDGLSGHENWLDLTQVAKTIAWVIEHPCLIPLIEIQANLFKTE
jgi:hypothetical protein